MGASDKYLQQWSPFGKIIAIEDRFYNPTAKVEARDGSISFHQLPKLIAFGLREESNGEHKHSRKTA